MVLRHGRVVAEGWADPYRPEHQQLVYSLSKTYASAAVGLAVADGALSYDDRLVDLFPDQVDERVGPKARTIRVRDRPGPRALGHVPAARARGRGG